MLPTDGLGTQVDRLARRCSPLSPCRDRTVADLDGLTVEAFARQHIGNMAALEAIVSACRVILGELTGY